jgi:hypothetical protein
LDASSGSGCTPAQSALEKMRTASSDAGVRAGFDSVFDGAVTRPDRVASCQDAYGFTELRIRFVRDDYYVWKQPYLVEFAVVEMQCSECDNLKYPRLLHKHRGRVALRVPPLAVRASGDGDGPMSIAREAKAKNQFTEHRRQMARAVRIAEWNLDQFWNQINPPQPFFDGGFEFALKYGRNTI